MSIKRGNTTVLQNFVNIPITSTITSSSTNEECAGAKDVYELFLKAINGNDLKIKEDLNDCSELTKDRQISIQYYKGGAINSPNINSYGIIVSYSVLNKNQIMQYCFEASGVSYIGKIYTRTSIVNGSNVTWTDWSSFKSNRINDISPISVTWETNDYYVDASTISTKACLYTVINGICYVRLYVKCISALTTNLSSTVRSIKDMPKPLLGAVYGEINRWDTLNADSLYFVITGDGDIKISGGTVGKNYVCSFSYPVAES